jgi:dipeptide transport system permease protein
MINFIFKRVLYGFLVVCGVVIILFWLFYVLPGDPVEAVMGGKGDAKTRQNVARELGLDQPIYTQFLYYVNDLSPIAIHELSADNYKKYNYLPIIPTQYSLVLKLPYLGRSYQSQRRVGEVIWEDIEGTIVLALTAMLFATLIGVGIGIVAALRVNTWVDYTLVSLSVVGISIPSFVLAILVSMFFGFYLSEYTGLKVTGSLWDMNPFTGDKELRLKNLILPAFTLALRPLSIIVQLTRSAMLEVLSQDYIRTARAKGVPFHKIILKHALKNALNPVVTAVSGWLASLMAGAFFIEYVFGWKGLGRTTIEAVGQRDLPLVMGATIVIACIFVVINIVVDILYALIDPRVRLE